ncbi:MAG: hypothetical protein KDC35_08060 [Acidobacteria bacterium]|nr:hypothetical protein [Acidobacteriota bacterium]
MFVFWLGLLVGEWSSWHLPCGSPSLAAHMAISTDAIHLVWIEPKSKDCGDVQYAAWDGETWTEPQSVRSGCSLFINWADTPKVAAVDGWALVTWPERMGEGTYEYGVYASRRMDGVFGEPFWLHESRTPAEHGFVSMAPLNDKIMAVWLDGAHMVTGGAMELHARWVSPTQLGPEQQVDDHTCECCSTSLAARGQGLEVVYRNKTDDHVRDSYAATWVDGNWTEGHAIQDDQWVIEGCPVNGPVNAPHGSQTARAWFTGVNGAAQVFVAKGDQIIKLKGEPMGRLGMAVLGDHVFVSWIDAAEGGTVRVARVSPQQQTAWAVASVPEGRSSGFPRLVVWHDRLWLAYQAEEGVLGAQIKFEGMFD